MTKQPISDVQRRRRCMSCVEFVDAAGLRDVVKIAAS
jgi:hypothetical protein